MSRRGKRRDKGQRLEVLVLLPAHPGDKWDSDRKWVGEGARAESCGPLLRSSEFFFLSVMEVTGEFEHETDLI